MDSRLETLLFFYHYLSFSNRSNRAMSLLLFFRTRIRRSLVFQQVGSRLWKQPVCPSLTCPLSQSQGKWRFLWAAIEPINYFKDMGPIQERPDLAHSKYTHLKNKFLRKTSKTQLLLIKARPTKHTSFANINNKGLTHKFTILNSS